MWWQGLSGLEKAYFIVGCVATLFLIIQIIMLLVGFSDDVDFEVDMDGDMDSGLSLFSVKTIIAFFCVGAWAGLLCLGTEMPDWAAILISFAAGAAALIGVAFALRAVSKLQSDGNLNYANAVGKDAEVYVRIPADGSGKGKVNVYLQERYVEIDAMTKGSAEIATGSLVKITDVLGDTVIVEPYSAEK